jgi:hypothetical protein
MGFLGIFAGVLAGVGTPNNALAYEGVTWYSNPGPTSSTANLNCGWHSDCLDPPDYGGPGLDWQNGECASVYFRGRGYRANPNETPLLIGTVYIGQRNGGCIEAVGDIVDSLGNYRGRVGFVHSQIGVSEGHSFNIYARYSGNYSNVAVAYSIPKASELSGCSITGPHLHQDASYGSWTQPAGYPVDNCSCSQGGQGDITGSSKWMYYTSWLS